MKSYSIKLTHRAGADRTASSGRATFSSRAAAQRLASLSLAQKGIALFISLVLLLVLTIVGVSSVQTTSLEERMARNAHDSVLAFQAAEMALRQAEEWLIANAPEATDFSNAGTNGLWTVAPFGVAPRWETAGAWSSGNTIQVPVAVANVDSQPRYMIEYLASIDQTADQYELGRGYPVLNETINVFRVTARGVGGTDSAQVLLQSSFGLIAN